MIIEKEELKKLFEKGEQQGTWNEFFGIANKIIKMTLSEKFPNAPDKEELAQECNMQVWKLIQKNQINKDANIFSYIMGATSFKARDAIRKENRRKKKVRIVHTSNDILIDLIEGMQYRES